MADSLHKLWLNYCNKYNANEDIKTLYHLLSDPSRITQSEEEIMDILYDAALVIIDSTSQLYIEQKIRAQYFSYNLCTCDACQKDYGAHINKKGQIRISKKFFHAILKGCGFSPIGLLELIYIILYEVLHGIFPEMETSIISEKAQQVMKTGVFALKNEKI